MLNLPLPLSGEPWQQQGQPSRPLIRRGGSRLGESAARSSTTQARQRPHWAKGRCGLLRLRFRPDLAQGAAAMACYGAAARAAARAGLLGTATPRRSRLDDGIGLGRLHLAGSLSGHGRRVLLVALRAASSVMQLPGTRDSAGARVHLHGFLEVLGLDRLPTVAHAGPSEALVLLVRQCCLDPDHTEHFQLWRVPSFASKAIASRHLLKKVVRAILRYLRRPEQLVHEDDQSASTRKSERPLSLCPVCPGGDLSLPNSLTMNH